MFLFPGELQTSSPHHKITITVTDWDLPAPLRSWEAVWDYGALALLNDCVYSAMLQHGYAYIGMFLSISSAVCSMQHSHLSCTDIDMSRDLIRRFFKSWFGWVCCSEYEDSSTKFSFFNESNRPIQTSSSQQKFTFIPLQELILLRGVQQRNTQ